MQGGRGNKGGGGGPLGEEGWYRGDALLDSFRPITSEEFTFMRPNPFCLAEVF